MHLLPLFYFAMKPDLLLGIAIGFLIAMLMLAFVVRWRKGRASRIGKRGERIVARELAGLRRKDYIVINDLLVPSANGRTSQIDHVVVSTRGIFIIETKSHAGRISGGENAQYWQQHLSSQTKTFYNPLLQNASHLRAVRRLLKARKDLVEEMFSSVVVFTDAWRLDIKADDIVIGRTLLPDKHIRRTVIPAERRKKRWWCPGKQVVLDEHKMATLLDGLIDELERRPRIIGRDSLRTIADTLLAANITGCSARREHTDYARRTSAEVSADIAGGICPRCGRPLVVRKGANGEFAGCTGYPACRFTCSIDRLRH